MSAAVPCVLVVADPGRIRELADALFEPLDRGPVEVVVSSGGDDTIELFESRRPMVVVVTASLELGDSKSLIEAVRAIAPRAEVGIVLIGDDAGPVRSALDALDHAPDRFLTRPLAVQALRFAVTSCLDAVDLARGATGGEPTRPRTKTDRGTGVGGNAPAPSAADDAPTNGVTAEATTPTPVAASPGSAGARSDAEHRAGPASPGSAEARSDAEHGAGPASPGSAGARSDAEHCEGPIDDAPTGNNTRAALRARWEALADSIGDDDSDDVDMTVDPVDEPAPLPPPVIIQPRRRSISAEPWVPGGTEVRADDAPPREPTLILRDEPAPATAPAAAPPPAAAGEPGPRERWSEPVLLAELADERPSGPIAALEDFEPLATPPPVVAPPAPVAPKPAATPPPEPPAGGRDFARQLREKMSMMAQRLFQQADTATPPVDVGPRHDHQTEIDLASLAEEPALGSGGVTEIESRAARPDDAREMPTTSPGTWDTQVRERGLPDSGEVVRAVSDAPMLLARMFAQSATGRIEFLKGEPGIVKVVFFDQGRPVFASSNEPGDRMGELLVREGKITASQYERCQQHAASSGRRMGEILVDFGYLKRRELLPAVRRHVEDILYSLFGWDRGHYRIHTDPTPSGERIRLSRHPAALILEGIRRKLDRTALEKALGASSTVIEVPDRERLGGIVHVSDLAPEERASLAAFDGQADLAQVARTAGIDVADLLPLAWGLCVLGLATARRAEAELVDESSALVGETDLEIDRERVRARWQLVSDADYFALLGVRRDATGFEIRRAYQSARRDFAADCFPNDLRRELAQELEDIASVLDEAFRVLRDDRLRQTYLSNLIE
ncbi:MAG TPA: DUF4388 domain-containing protein [Kofleriaceae bacterium]|nr:DUF4388 domain-containing protein [Kofleriaceae bacterium]